MYRSRGLDPSCSNSMEVTMKNPVIIYHYPCADGFTGAWLCHRVFGECEFVPAAYRDIPPDTTNRDVIIVDFSYPRDLLLEIEFNSRSLHVFDHHKTAQENCEGLEFAVFDMDKCGTRILWEWLKETYNITNVPISFNHFLDYIEDRDLWRWQLYESRAVNAAIRSYEMTLDNWDQLVSKSLQDLVTEGRAIQRYRRQLIDQHKRWAATMVIGGIEVPAVYCTVPEITSEIAGELSEGHPFAACYRDNKKGRKFELRSREGGIDVSEIAKQYGGGGHKHAAGFQLIDETTL